jgi:hypothetical protein
MILSQYRRELSQYEPEVDSGSNRWVLQIFSGGKNGRWVWLTALPSLCADCLEILEALTSWSSEVQSGLCYYFYGNRNSDSLRDGRSRNRNLVGWVFPYLCWAALKQSQPPSKCVAGVFPGGKVAVTWLWWLNPSGHTVALRSNQPLTGMSTRDLSWSKGGRCFGLTTLPLPYIEFLKCIEASTPWCPRGLPRFLQR